MVHNLKKMVLIVFLVMIAVVFQIVEKIIKDKTLHSGAFFLFVFSFVFLLLCSD